MHGPDGYSNNSPANATWRVEQLHRKIEMHRDEIVLTRTFEAEDAEVLLIAFGATTRASRAAALELRKKGVKAGVLQLVTLWPFADKEVARFGSRARTVVVTEMNYSGQMAGEVRKVLGSGVDIRQVNSWNGQIITPRQILQGIG
jgi:2-oxoglutarate ferredoxin oxidoreductase subunit alpha